MALTAEQKSAIVSTLTANCDCTPGLPWQGKDAAALNAMSDEKLMTMDECYKAIAKEEKKKAKPAANVATEPAPTPTLTPALTANATPAPTPPPATKVLTAEEFIGTLFPGMTVAQVQGAVVNAVRIDAQAKAHAAAQLQTIAAVEQNPQRKALIEAVLNANPSLDRLNETLLLVGPPVQNQFGVPTVPNYFGAAGVPPTTNVKDDSDNVLPMATFNFEEYASPKLRQKQKQA